MEENERDKTGEDEDEKQELWWSWGAGTEGQLCSHKLQDEHLPLLLPSLSSAGPISFLSCGGAHVLALTPCGKVLTWGRGTSGQLGHGDEVNSLQPQLVSSLETSVISHVSAGWSHSGFLSDCGSLFTCGDSSFGQLGHGDYISIATPKLVSHFASKHVHQIAFGMRHSLVALKGDLGDQVYGFGSGKRGQLCVLPQDRIKSLSVPHVIIGFEDVNIASVSANGDHSAALSSDGHLYTWGRGFSGDSDAYYPQCVPSSMRFKQTVLGWNHGLVLTGDGEIFMLGGYHHLQKSRTPKHSSVNSTELSLHKVDGLHGIKVVQIAAGAEHSALVTENGVIKTWGWGEHGQLGLGNTDNQTNPQDVALDQEHPHQHATYKVYCGSGFTFALKSLNLHSDAKKRFHSPAAQSSHPFSKASSTARVAIKASTIRSLLTLPKEQRHQS